MYEYQMSQYQMAVLINIACIVVHYVFLYEGCNFNFGNTPLDWIQELLE